MRIKTTESKGSPSARFVSLYVVLQLDLLGFLLHSVPKLSSKLAPSTRGLNDKRDFVKVGN